MGLHHVALPEEEEPVALALVVLHAHGPGFAPVALKLEVQGFGVGVVWVPLTLLTFATLDARYRAEAMSLFHLLRNIGSSFFISVSVGEILRSGAKNYSRMTEMITPTAKTLQNPQTMGGWTIDTLPGLTAISKEITRQAVMIGYLNAFAMYTVACTAAIALAFLARGRPRAASG